MHDVTIAVLYWSGAGHTRRLAELIGEGIGQAARLIDVTDVSEVDQATIDQADAMIFGGPTYMGSLAGPMKTWLEDASAGWVDQTWANRIAAGFTVATYPSGDKLSTLTQLAVFAAQHGMIWVGQQEIGAPVNTDAPGINSGGSWLGLTATSSRDKTLLIDPGDAETARRFGARIAQATLRWKHGGSA